MGVLLKMLVRSTITSLFPLFACRCGGGHLHFLRSFYTLEYKAIHSLTGTRSSQSPTTMATTLRAFLTLLVKEDSSSRRLEEGDRHPRASARPDEDSFITTSSLVYKMYKRVVHHAADETSSEMTFDCSSFSEHDYYDLDEDFGVDDGSSFGLTGGFKQGKDHMTFSPLETMIAPDSLLSALPPSTPSSTSIETAHLPSYAAVHQDWQSISGTDETLLLQELSDRASSLLQRESCCDYTVKNYFQRMPGCCPRFPSSAAVASIVSSTDSSSLSTHHVPALPVDSKCRSIMMNWSFRVAEFSLLNHERGHRQQVKARLLSRAFSYVDRICTKFEIANRDQYKLLTIVCLHLSAKVGGLLKSGAQVYDCYERRQRRSSDDTASTSVSTRSLSSTSLSSAVMSVESHQTIVPTPHSLDSVADSSFILQEVEQQDQTESSCSTEYIWLLSLHGLHSLCNEEFTMEEFKQMECAILHHGLGWRLSSVVALDWVDIYLELMVLHQPPLLLRRNRDQKDMNLTCGKRNFLSFSKAECNDIRDATLTQLEYALKRPCFMTCAPSLLGLATFLNVMKGYCSVGSNDCDLVLLSCIEEAIGLNIDYDDLYDIQVQMMFEHDECLV